MGHSQSVQHFQDRASWGPYKLPGNQHTNCSCKTLPYNTKCPFPSVVQPKVEQAKTQPGRGCEEPILTIRLIDIARKCGLPEGV